MEDEDKAARLTAALPAWLQSERRRWAALLALCLFGSLASGPVASWPQLEPMLLEKGVSQSELDLVMSVATGVSVASSLPVGLLYDRLGPRCLGVWGALGCALGLLGMAHTVQHYSSLGGTCLTIFYTLATTFGAAQQWGALAYLWILPDHQNTVNSCASAIQTLSDSSVLVAVLLHSTYGLDIASFFSIVAVLALLAAVVDFLLIPDRHQIHAFASVVTKSPPSTTDYGTVTPPEPATSKYPVVFSTERAYLRDAWTLGTRLHPRAIGLVVVFCISLYLCAFFPLMEQLPFYSALLGHDDALRLLNSFAIVYALVGAISVLAFGVLTDAIGVTRAVLWTSALVCLTSITLLIRSFAGQLAAQVLLTMCINLATVVVTRASMLYAPVELFGTCNGALMAIMGSVQMLFTPFLRALAARAAPHDAVARYELLFVGTGSCTVLSGLALGAFWTSQPPPKPGSVTLAMVRSQRGRDHCQRDRVIRFH